MALARETCLCWSGTFYACPFMPILSLSPLICFGRVSMFHCTYSASPAPGMAVLGTRVMPDTDLITD